MSDIAEKEWGFESVRAVDETRATRLESVASPEDLVENLAEALNETIDAGELRIAVDSKRNAFTELRAIVQFKVTPELYDWFFNARTGYRARFLIGPGAGLAFNRQVVEALTAVLRQRLPAKIIARQIEVTSEPGTREERDAGAMEITRDELLRSLAPDASKIWIGERLYSRTDGLITDIGFATLSNAARSRAKLRVPRWAEATNPKTGEKGEGLRAPFPCPENSWLDLKGGFLEAEGNPTQIIPRTRGRITFMTTAGPEHQAGRSRLWAPVNGVLRLRRVLPTMGFGCERKACWRASGRR